MTDIGDVSGYAREAVQVMYSNRILLGKGDGVFDPRGTTTRGEMAALLARVLCMLI